MLVCVCVCVHGGHSALPSVCLFISTYVECFVLLLCLTQDTDNSKMTDFFLLFSSLCSVILQLWKCCNQIHPFCVEKFHRFVCYKSCSLGSLFCINQTCQSREQEIQQNFFFLLLAFIKHFSEGLSCQARWEQTGRLRGSCSNAEVPSDGCEGSEESVKAWRWPPLAVSQTPKHTMSVQMFKVFGFSGASSLLLLIWVGNASAEAVCFLCVCGLNCRFTYISDPLSVLPLLLPMCFFPSFFFPHPRSFQMGSWRRTI